MIDWGGEKPLAALIAGVSPPPRRPPSLSPAPPRGLIGPLPHASALPPYEASRGPVRSSAFLPARLPLSGLAFHSLSGRKDASRRGRKTIGHSSVPQAIIACYRMRLSLSLQCSQALAIHKRAGRALAQANGFRGGGLAPQYSMSDMHVLIRGYLVSPLASSLPS
eukprot:SM000159S01805  [mRNA]  locus=s159:200410:200918:- [translate_table: standard]